MAPIPARTPETVRSKTGWAPTRSRPSARPDVDGVLTMNTKPSPSGGLWPRALCSVCGLLRRTGRARCLVCGASLLTCDCTWRPDTGETILKQHTSVLSMLMQGAAAGSGSGPVPDAAPAVPAPGRASAEPVPLSLPPYRLTCCDAGLTFDFEARPTKLRLGWPRVRCRGCNKQHRVSALACARCELAFLDCACKGAS